MEFRTAFRALALATLAICIATASRAETQRENVDIWLDYVQRLPKPQVVTDFLSPQTALEFPVYPANATIAAQNPPVFHWRYDAVDTTYEL